MSINDVFTGSIPLSIIPENVHPAARRWEEYRDKTVEAENKVKAAEAAKARAATEDGAALKAAILDGEKDPGTKHQDAATKQLAEAQRQYEALNSIFKDKSRELLVLLRENRDGIYAIAKATVTPAADKYREVVAEAEAKVTEASTELAHAYAGVSLLESLDSGYGGDIGASIPNIPAPEFGRGLTIADTMSSNLEEVEQPLGASILHMVHPTDPTRRSGVDSEMAKYYLNTGWTVEPLYEGHDPVPAPKLDPQRRTDTFDRIKR